MDRKDQISIGKELLKQAARALEQAEKLGTKSSGQTASGNPSGNTPPAAAQADTDIPEDDSVRGKWRKFCTSAFNSAASLYRKTEPVVHVVAYPIINWGWPAARYAGRKWWDFFVWSSWKTDAQTGDVKFSRVGAAHALLATAAAGAAMTVITPLAMRFTYDASMSMTQRTQYMYTHGSESISEGETYSIRTSPLMPVTEKNTLYLHAERDLFYRIWTPENLTVPQETCWGKITYTGFRVKLLGWYPEVKSVEVTPLSKLPSGHAANQDDYEPREARWWWQGTEETDNNGYTAPSSPAAPAP